MKYQVCKEALEYHTELGELRAADELVSDPACLRERLADDGYLLLRGFHPERDVLAARERIQEQMRARGLRTGQHRELGDIGHAPEVKAVLESERLFALFAALCGESAITLDEKWLRATGHGVYTGIHYDSVYMNRGSPRLHTVWTPFGHVPIQMGALAICVGSHREPFRKLQDTYGRMDVDRDRIGGYGWYSHRPREVLEKFGGHWCTTEYRPGDILIFTMLTLHCSAVNMTQDVRISCDTRFQPEGDPVDERWSGPGAAGHTVFGTDVPPVKSIEEAKAEWGV